MPSNNESMDALIDEAARLLRNSIHAIALTGAGVSTASGIPDFRGPGGLYTYVPEHVFDISFFNANPAESWKWLRKISRHGAKPNPAHYALAAMEKRGLIQAVITQNVDGLHQAAGSVRVIELHGSSRSLVCTRCGYRIGRSEAGRLDWSPGYPVCPSCGAAMKPDVVFFGEPLPHDALKSALELAEMSDLILVAGSSLTVSPANMLPSIVKSNGGRVIIVNGSETSFDPMADVVIRGRVEVVLPELCRRATGLEECMPEGC